MASRLPCSLARSKIHLCRPAFIPAFCPSQRFGLWGLAVAPGFACNHCAGFKPFWPLAPVPRALAALSLVAFRGCAALFQTPSGLTRRSSRSAFGGRLTSFVRHAQAPSRTCTKRIARNAGASSQSLGQRWSLKMRIKFGVIVTLNVRPAAVVLSIAPLE